MSTRRVDFVVGYVTAARVSFAWTQVLGCSRSVKASAAVLHPRVLRGGSLAVAGTAARSDLLCRDRLFLWGSTGAG